MFDPYLGVPNTPQANQDALTDAMPPVDLGGFDLTDLGLFQQGSLADDVFKGLDITQRAEVNPDDWVDIFNNYSNFLAGVQSGNTDKKVNRRDNIYNDYFKQNVTSQYLGDPSALRAAVGLSDAFSVYDTAGNRVTEESLKGAYQTLTSGESFQQVLADYYGFDFQPATNEGADYSNASKYGVDAQKMQEFQSLVEPILQKSIPYIQATQGLSYTDALEYAYSHDPMLNALYQSYGVDLYRQTKDGSTYIYDPIAGQEIRTLEVKDAKFKDVLPALAKAGIFAVATAGIGSALGGFIGKSSLGSVLGASGSKILGSALASGLTTGLSTGFDEKAMLKAMLQAGLTSGTVELLKTDGMREVLNSFGESIGLPSEFTDTDILQQGNTVLESGTTTTSVMGLGDTLATLVGGEGSWQTVDGVLKPFFFDKSIEGILDFIPESFWKTIDPALLGTGNVINTLNNLITGQGGAGGQGGTGGTVVVPPSEEEEEDDEDQEEDDTILPVEEEDDTILPVEEEEDDEEEDDEEENQTEPDTDGDGIPDSQDSDIDGDGVPNDQDPDPFDPSIFEDTTVDSDGDGIADDDDPFPSDPLNGEGDRDGDGIKDKDDAFPDDPLNGGSDDDDEDDAIPPVVTNTEPDPDPDDDDDDDDDPTPPVVVNPDPVNPTLPSTGGGSGRGGGLFSSGGGAGFDPKSFMASISYNPQLLTPFMPQNSRDYLSELLARLQK